MNHVPFPRPRWSGPLTFRNEHRLVDAACARSLQLNSLARATDLPALPGGLAVRLYQLTWLVAQPPVEPVDFRHWIDYHDLLGEVLDLLAPLGPDDADQIDDMRHQLGGDR